MKNQNVQDVLSRIGIPGVIQHARTLTSSVTTAWGVDWSETYIARDLMQNFFDANRERLDEIQVQTNGADAVIKAPTPFNLERLFYLGSEKEDDDIGQYGEGFKVAATCLLRDHSVQPIAVSGRNVLALRVSDNAVADTRLYPVQYDFYQCDHATEGTLLLLTGCSKKLLKALAGGMSHFLYDKNTLLGEKKWSDYSDMFSIYASTSHDGYIFYRKLRRGDIEGVPVILVIDKEYKRIENKISKDRDRNAFGEEMMDLFYTHFAKYGVGGKEDAERIIVEASRRYWEKGHPLLNNLALAHGYDRPWSTASVQEVFGDKYYARSTRERTPTKEDFEIERLEQCWQDEGRKALPGYFHRFGVPSAQKELQRLHKLAVEEDRNKGKRKPTMPEMGSIQVLLQALKELAPDMMTFFEKKETNYTVARTEAILGSLRSGRDYWSKEVFLSESVFVDDFPGALATFLHEHAHIFGHDGTRSFTDALTRLFETVVRHRMDLDQYEENWEKARKAIQAERRKSAGDRGTEDMEDWLSTLGHEDMRELLNRIPMPLLRKLRQDQE